MVRLYTSGKYFKDNEIIIDNDSFFNNNVSAKSLSENSIKVMEEVDHATRRYTRRSERLMQRNAERMR